MRLSTTIFLIFALLVVNSGNVRGEGLRVQIDDEFEMKVQKFNVENMRSYDLSGMGLLPEEGLRVIYTIYLFRYVESRNVAYVDVETDEAFPQTTTKTFDLGWSLSYSKFPDPVLIIYTDWSDIKASVSRNLESLANAMKAPMPDYKAEESGDSFNIKYTIDRSESTSYEEFTISEKYSYYKSSGIIRYYEFHVKINDDGEISKVDFIYQNANYSSESIDLSFFRDNGLVITLILIIVVLIAFIIKREFFFYEDYEEDDYTNVEL